MTGPFPIHPLAETFPLMEGTEFDALVTDIKDNGLINPIPVFEDMVLDGRNRLRACESGCLQGSRSTPGATLRASW
jgi:ParB-like chromosome segregation protein Spo0J